jgi:hypothetical protein
MQRATTARTGRPVLADVRRLDREVPMRQMVGRIAATRRRFRLRRRLGDYRGDLLLGPGDIRLDVFQSKLHLVGIEAFGAPAEHGPLHLPEQQLQLLQFGQLGLLALDHVRQIAHQLLEQARVGRQVVQVEAHDGSLTWKVGSEPVKAAELFSFLLINPPPLASRSARYGATPGLPAAATARPA